MDSNVLDPNRQVLTSQRDIASEIDYSDAKSAIKNLAHVHRKGLRSPSPSNLTNENLQKLERLSNRSVISKGGGGSIYSDVRSQYSKYKNHIKELST